MEASSPPDDQGFSTPGSGGTREDLLRAAIARKDSGEGGSTPEVLKRTQLLRLSAMTRRRDSFEVDRSDGESNADSPKRVDERKDSTGSLGHSAGSLPSIRSNSGESLKSDSSGEQTNSRRKSIKHLVPSIVTRGLTFGNTSPITSPVGGGGEDSPASMRSPRRRGSSHRRKKSAESGGSMDGFQSGAQALGFGTISRPLKEDNMVRQVLGADRSAYKELQSIYSRVVKMEFKEAIGGGGLGKAVKVVVFLVHQFGEDMVFESKWSSLSRKGVHEWKKDVACLQLVLDLKESELRVELIEKTHGRTVGTVQINSLTWPKDRVFSVDKWVVLVPKPGEGETSANAVHPSSNSNNTPVGGSLPAGSVPVEASSQLRLVINSTPKVSFAARQTVFTPNQVRQAILDLPLIGSWSSSNISSFERGRKASRFLGAERVELSLVGILKNRREALVGSQVKINELASPRHRNSISFRKGSPMVSPKTSAVPSQDDMTRKRSMSHSHSPAVSTVDVLDQSPRDEFMSPRLRRGSGDFSSPMPPRHESPRDLLAQAALKRQMSTLAATDDGGTSSGGGGTPTSRPGSMTGSPRDSGRMVVKPLGKRVEVDMEEEEEEEELVPARPEKPTPPMLKLSKIYVDRASGVSTPSSEFEGADPAQGSYQQAFDFQAMMEEEDRKDFGGGRASGEVGGISASPSMFNLQRDVDRSLAIPMTISMPDIASVLKSQSEEEEESLELLDSPGSADLDLNERYQSALDRLMQLEIKSEKSNFEIKLEVLSELVEISETFISTALLYGRIIISEAFLPEEQRTVKPIRSGGQLGGRKYLVRGVLFKFALDDAAVFAANVDPKWACSKIAGHELKGLKMYQATNTHPLSYPLCCLINYMGLRLVAMTELPIGKETLVYGSDDAGVTVKTADEEVNALVQVASRQLNISSHKCGANGSQIIHSAVDLEGHRGRDGRIYLIDFSRGMPPVEVGQGGEHLYRLFRPEYLQIYGIPLSSDAFSKFQTDEAEAKELNAKVLKAARHLHNTYIPTVAVTQLLARARGYTNLAKFMLTTEMQQLGVNARYLGVILRELDTNSSVIAGFQLDEHVRALQELILIEISSRAVKNFLRKRLRDIAELSVYNDELFYREICFVLNSCLCGEQSGQDYFRANLYDLFQTNFYVDLRRHDPLSILYDSSFQDRWGVCAQYLILKRTKHMMGVDIAKTAMTVLKKNPALFNNLGFLDRFDITALKPLLKHSNIVEIAKASLFALRAQLQVADISKIRYFELSEKHWQNSSPNTVDYCVQYADCCSKHAQTLKRYARSEQQRPANLDEQLQNLAAISQQYFTRALSLEPGNSFIYFKFALSLDFFGATEQADTRFLQALLIDPSAPELLRAYSMFLECQKGDPAMQSFAVAFSKRSEKAYDAMKLHRALSRRKNSGVSRSSSKGLARSDHSGGSLKK